MDITSDIARFLVENPSAPSPLKETLESGTPTDILACLSQYAAQTDWEKEILCSFEQLVPELIARWAIALDVDSLLSSFGRLAGVFPYVSEYIVSSLLKLRATNGDLLDIKPSQGDTSITISVLLAIFRLISHKNKQFGQFVTPVKLIKYMQHDDKCVRYLAIRILSLYLHLSDERLQTLVLQKVGEGAIHGRFDEKDIDFTFLSLWEDKRIEEWQTLLHSPETPSKKPLSKPKAHRVVVNDENLSYPVINVFGTLAFRERRYDEATSVEKSIVATETTTRNASRLMQALKSNVPVLVTGSSECGKTTLINYITSQINPGASLITMHLNEQTDVKTMIGVHTTGQQPGTFVWQPGVLTRAMQDGRCILIEDLDRVPQNIMGSLTSILKRRELRIPGREAPLVASPKFQIFATMRGGVDRVRSGATYKSRGIVSHLWYAVEFQPLISQEFNQIAESRFPLLSRFVGRMTTIFEFLLRQSTLAGSSRSRRRSVSARDYFKWCARTDAALRASHYSQATDAYPESILDGIYLDAMDCFAGSLLAGSEERLGVSSHVAKVLHIAPERREFLETLRSPTVELPTLDNARFVVGRCVLSRINKHIGFSRHQKGTPFSLNRFTRKVMEQVAVALRGREPLLLVGETGIGKTSAIQHLAKVMDQKLVVINLSQQSESGDILGGFKPVTIRSFIIPMKEEFDALFAQTFSRSKNEKFSGKLAQLIARKKWKEVVKFWREALKVIERSSEEQPLASVPTGRNEQGNKRRKIQTDNPRTLATEWANFAQKVHSLEQRLKASTEAFAFAFIEGEVIKAVRSGAWVLLDEINLASADTLDCLSNLLDCSLGFTPSIQLAEAGAAEIIKAHPNFRIFAAMNPSTDIGKRELPLGIRSRFTEIYIDSPERDFQSLYDIAVTYLFSSSPTPIERELCNQITMLYLKIQEQSTTGKLIDGSGQKPHYSLRSFTRALSYAKSMSTFCSIRRALYEGFNMCFATTLEDASESALQKMLYPSIFKDFDISKELKKPVKCALGDRDIIKAEIEIIDRVDEKRKSQTHVETHWLPKGRREDIEQDTDYIVTPYIARNLRNLIRTLSAGRFPVLIQGPTSAGKTSMVEYLARRSGNELVRINNHEHTDLQEYVGTYISTATGQLVFHEGVLVQALRAGHWVVLDELNLAPTDVLEALNRLLDENRELMIPETQEVVRPHPNFMLFATQNPAGAYGGRKALSRAFRSRFLELHFEDIPVEELNVILAKRSQLPTSWCRQITAVYSTLPRLRQQSRLFEDVTLRDLFRWAFRRDESIESVARSGFMLLAEKVRSSQERQFVKQTIEKVMSRKGTSICIDDGKLYRLLTTVPAQDDSSGLVWTSSMRRLFSLVDSALKQNEPVLLVGETGCGKTRVCQFLASLAQNAIITVNAHQNMETSDLIGAQRPVRDREAIESQLLKDLKSALSYNRCVDVSEPITTQILLDEYESLLARDTASVPFELRQRIRYGRSQLVRLFEWQDGPLVDAMRNGYFFLLDEISLADDSVLERMNSVLDPQRSILLAEKGTGDSTYTAKDGFQFLATMNPAGDYGKKELSAALRNRFTEIWVPSMNGRDDAIEILQAKLCGPAVPFAASVVDFAQWFTMNHRSSRLGSVSIRDLLTCAEFVNVRHETVLKRILHGILLVYIDTIGSNASGGSVMVTNAHEERRICLAELGRIFNTDFAVTYDTVPEENDTRTSFGFGDFTIKKESEIAACDDFDFSTPTTRVNATRILRALQISKPVLIEGDPGVGKTSLISAIAQKGGYTFHRINLSEQTDLMDLFGSDVPVEGGEVGSFVWKDAPFLTAMKQGHWVLLDEMNLASQPVLEGLNSCIDHRGEVFIPELGKTFPRHPEFRLFAAQNPHTQGSGRKGLPMSFVNRFSVVFADAFSADDMISISSKLYPNVETAALKRVVGFVIEISHAAHDQLAFSTHGRPWEFNLRDVLRFLQIFASRSALLPALALHDIANILFVQRFRTENDNACAIEIVNHHFGGRQYPRSLFYNLTPRTFQVGAAMLKRQDPPSVANEHTHHLSKVALPIWESIMISIQMNWPVILVGPSGSRKTELLSSLASVIGQKLDIVSLSADTDTNDLIGSFDHVNPQHKTRQLCDSILNCSKNCLNGVIGDAKFSTLARSLNTLISLAAAQNNIAEALHQIRELLRDVLVQLDRLGFEHLESYRRQMHKLDLSILDLSSTGTSELARFHWVDGSLITAIQKGHWLVLENANYSSSAVLDRLNSLLEPAGSLIVNEHCGDDGRPKILTPHKNFRIFLTIDPKHGEISRAMRNRAVELYLSQPCEVTPWVKSPLRVSDWRFTMLRSIIKEIPSSEFVYEMAMERLAFSDFLKMPQFIEQCYKGLVGSSEADMLGTIYGRASKRLNGIALQVSKKFFDVKSEEAGFDTVWIDHQPIQPLVNHAMVCRSDHGTGGFNLMALAVSFDVVYEVSRMRAALFASDLSLTSSTRSMRSITSNEPRASAQEFLYLTLQNFETWGAETAQSIYLSQDDVSFFATLASLWWNLLKMIGDQLFSTGNMIPHLIAARRYIMTVSDLSTASTSLCGHFNRELSRLSQLSIDTAISMRRLWALLRGRIYRSKSQLNDAIEAHRSAARFDLLARNSPTSIIELSQVRESILSSVRDSTQHQSSSRLWSTLADNMPSEDQLDEDTNTSSHFQPIFDQSCRLKDLAFSCRPQLAPHFPLDTSGAAEILAGRPLAQSLMLEPDVTPHGRLDGLIAFATQSSETATTYALQNQLTAPLSYKIASMLHVPISRLLALREESKWLGLVLASQTPTMQHDMLDMLNACMRSLLVSVLNTHKEMLHESSRELIAGLEETIRNGKTLSVSHPIIANPKSSAKFRQAVELYLSPALSVSPNTQGVAAQSASSLIAFGIGCLLLYVPDQVHDPALESMIELDIYRHRLRFLKKKLETVSYVETKLTDQHENLRTMFISQEIEDLGPEPDVEQVVRPADYAISDLEGCFDNLQRFQQRLAAMYNSGLIHELFKSERIVDCDRIVKRLQSVHLGYRDIVKPLVGFVQCIKLGLSVGVESLQRNNQIHRGTSAVDGVASLSLSNLMNWRFQGVSRAPQINLYNVQDAFEHLAYAEFCFCAYEDVAELPRQRDDIEISLSFIYNHWKNTLMDAHKKEDQSSSLYHYRGDEEIELDDDAIVADLFPSSKSHIAASPENNMKGKVLVERLSEQTAYACFNLFNPVAPAMHNVEKVLNRLSQRSSAGDSEPVPPTQDAHETLRSMAFNMVSLEEGINALEGPSSPETKYNFYVDPNVTQCDKLRSITCAVKDRFDVISKSWPEHAVLLNTIIICKDILSLPLHEPVAKLLTKVEQLYSSVEEWSKVASREFNVAQNQEWLRDLIIAWRRLELSTWARLLDMEDEKSASAARTWWFIAYEIAMADDNDDNGECSKTENEEAICQSSTSLISTLEELLRNSSVGQFNTRLNILETLQKCIDIRQRKGKLLESHINALQNLVQHYKRYLTSINKFIQDERNKIQKEIADVIKLASWRDTNILALKQSAKASHNKLFRSVRKYRDVLSRPCLAHLQYDVTQNDNTDTPPARRAPLSAEVADTGMSFPTPSRGQNWPLRYRNPTKTAETIQDMGSGWTRNGQKAAARLSEFVASLQASVTQLRDATPSTFTDDNATKIKHLTSRKQRLLADTLKDLREAGLRTSLPVRVSLSQDSRAKLLAILPCSDFSDRFGATDILPAAIDKITEASELAKGHSNDINPQDVARSYTLLQSLLAEVVQQRKDMFQYSNQMRRLDDNLSLLQCACDSRDNYVKASPERDDRLHRCQTILAFMPVFIQSGVRMLESQSRLGNLDLSRLTALLQGYVLSFESQRKELKSLPKPLPRIIPSAQEELCNRVLDLHCTFVSKVNDLMAEFQIAKPALLQMLSWSELDKADSYTGNYQEPATPFKRVDEKIQEALDNMLGSVQDVNVIRERFDSNASGWLTATSSHVTALLRAARCKEIIHSLELISESFFCLPEFESSFAETMETIGYTLPIARQYAEVVRLGLSELESLHFASTRALYSLSGLFCQIAQHGFCKPSEKSEGSGQQSEKLESGTGLGEGEGAADISGDLQSDEDLSELGAEDDGNNQGEPLERNTDALDVDSELKGGTGDTLGDESVDDDSDKLSSQRDEQRDIDGGENAEGPNTGTKDEDESADDAIGDVDDLEPSAVDEKFWDDASKDESRNKSSENKAKNRVEGEQAAGQDDQGEGAEQSKADQMEEDDAASSVESISDSVVSLYFSGSLLLWSTRILTGGPFRTARRWTTTSSTLTPKMRRILIYPKISILTAKTETQMI